MSGHLCPQALELAFCIIFSQFYRSIDVEKCRFVRKSTFLRQWCLTPRRTRTGHLLQLQFSAKSMLFSHFQTYLNKRLVKTFATRNFYWVMYKINTRRKSRVSDSINSLSVDYDVIMTAKMTKYNTRSETAF